MRRSLVLTVLIAVLLATTGVALAKFKGGIYRTKPPTSRSTFLDLSLDLSAQAIHRVRFDVSKARGCRDGNGWTDTENGYRFTGFAIRQGRFTATGTFSGGGTSAKVVITGRLNERTVTGTLRSTATLASTRCDSGLMRWTAQKLG